MSKRSLNRKIKRVKKNVQRSLVPKIDLSLNRKIKRVKKNVQRNLVPKVDLTLKHRKLTVDIEHRSTNIINLVGYTILFLILLDYGFLLISSQLFNPNWAYNTAGKLVENVWGLFLGLLLIFYRRDQDIVKPKESFILKIVSWLTLLAGISYFLLAPVIVGNSFRIYRNTQAQVTFQIEQQKTQVEQYTQQLQQANRAEIGSLFERYSSEQNDSNISATTAGQMKDTLIAEVDKQQVQAEKQLRSQFNSDKTNLLKTTIKWLIGSIVSGICFVLIWRHTKWARKLNTIDIK